MIRHRHLLPGTSLPDPAEVAREEIRHARRSLKRPADVHEARRTLKRARALLRLCETGPRELTARRIREGLRDAARRLSPLRDVEASLEVALDPGAGQGLPPGLMEALERSRDAAQATLDQGGLAKGIRQELSALRKEVEALRGAGEPGEVVGRVGEAYRRAREAWQAARVTPRGELLHTLRKRGKDLRHQVEWLSPAWPPVLGAWGEELHALTDDLGALQDLRILRTVAREVVPPGDRQALARALRDLRRESRRGRRRALARGRRLFAEEPGAFADRMTALATG